MDSSLFLQQMVNGFSLGSMYALIAIGYTMVYGVLRLINFAHGDIMMVGAYAALFSMTSLSLPFGFALLFAITVAIILGVFTDRVAYKPLRKAPRISLLITAIGISFLLENVFQVIFGGTPRSFPVPSYFEQLVTIGSVNLAMTAILVPIITLFLLSVVLFILYRTKYGMAIRALAFDISTVNLMGIDANMIISIVFALGSSLAAIGGVFWALNYPSIDPLMGVLIGLKAFAAAVLGGIGSVGGAVLGGFIIGFTEVVAVALFPDLAGFKDAFAFIFLILVLLFKPTGILGYNFEKSRF
ncbi:branched-chain amino acid ABC transporter permease [Campylobacter fetus]|uniref:Branched-chain amino acid ABC transporter permease n=1 Tax=Campylobacter fetus TaxID=196 RepID=A0A5L8QSP6_CAMFE|nr:branched-chain amino acid ABC transporter permease [Campylobacter fetus]EAI4414777.1 branched-chain amino acid ABC transporter permease [Campylobacter fetus]EAI5408426.1 branched-chain amino acid ABC transporter permease [Campylobacter fetus]EAJ0327172.1 branched-chain amino acid ABC transporter permease [Campylobacter fetus]EAJ1230488.1 branched-chain amino acid ABC transporter permease [Campylobacter fetus]EAK0415527.1 branched-chain amino acid ABC transporter permease [Campylobacter fetu